MQSIVLVYLDLENRNVCLFGKINRVIPFAQAFLVPYLLEGEQILYIHSVVPVDSESVTAALQSVVTESDMPTERMFVRCTQEGYVRVSELKMTFSGPKDIKPVDKYGWDMFDKSATLRKLLREGKIQLITESQVKNFKKSPAVNRDKALKGLIIDKPVDDFLDDIKMWGDKVDHLDEVTGDQEELTEAEKILRDHKDWGKK